MRYLLDSVVLIDHFNGIPEATTFLADHREEAAVSVISRAEVLVGFDGESRTLARGLLDRFPTLPIERPLADLAAELRQQHRWRLPDAFQAALALYHGLRLVTRNTKHFRPEEHQFVLVPYEI
jgi:predicted nucleic acid-binding protein